MTTPRSLHRAADPPRQGQKGFILILVLVLVALVTMLMVVISIMARVERHASYNAARIELARGNALFALDVALGQLQREAGPDQRVTARADILSSGTSIYQPQWTGVWKVYNPAVGPAPLDPGTTTAPLTAVRPWSTNLNQIAGTSGAPYTVDAANPNMVWLVSGGTNNATVNPTTTSTSSWIPNSAVVAQNLSITGSNGLVTGTSVVAVPLVPIIGNIRAGTSTTGTLGQYGYWVSDEGVKAKVNISDPTLSPPSPANVYVNDQLHFMTPQATATVNNDAGAYPSTNPPVLGGSNQVDTRTVGNLSHVTSLQSLGLVNGISGLSGTNAEPVSVDATTYSYGVLSDVAHGGLKTDLTALLEDTGSSAMQTPQWSPFLNALSTANDANGDAKVFSITTGTGAASICGPRWQSLYNYYNLYKSTIPYSPQSASSSPYFGLTGFGTSVPGPQTTTPTIHMRAYSYKTIPTAGSTSTTLEMGEYYMPELAAMWIEFSMSSEVVGTQTSGTTTLNVYQLRLYAQPKLALFNPYNAILTSPTSSGYTYQYALNTNIVGGGTWTIVVGGSNIWNYQTSNNAVGEPLYYTGGHPVTTSTTNGLVSTGTGTNNSELSIVTGTDSPLVFKPGEVRVFGLGNLSQVAPGYEITYAPQSSSAKSPFGTAPNTVPLTGTDNGQAQWGYIPGEAGQTPVIWQAAESDTANVVITFTNTYGFGFQSNDGRLDVWNGTGGHSAPAALCWPSGGSPWATMGRFSAANPQETGTQVALGQIGGAMKQTSSSTSTGVPFAYFIMRLKGVQQYETAIKGVKAMPVFAGVDGYLSPLPKNYDTGTLDIDFNAAQSAISKTEIQATTSPPFDSFYGNNDVGYAASDPQDVVLKDIPRQPMVSLGQLMGMPMRNSMNVSLGNEFEENETLLPVGGSYCDPFIETSGAANLSQTWTNNEGTIAGNAATTFLMDDNFLMNQALFDTYFFSTVPPASPSPAYNECYPGLTGPGGSFTLANINSRSVTLPNSRMQVYFKNGVSLTSTTALQTGTTAAASLMLNGAFNVNSTSVPAWVALLSSLSGTSANYLTGGSFAPLTTGSLQNPIFRFLSPVSVTENNYGSVSYPVNDPWGGVHALSNAQVAQLAQQIVNQVRLRGPFLSMADFFNRRLDPNTTGTTGFGFKGALQAAIDNTNINSTNLNIAAMTTSTGAFIAHFNPYDNPTPIPPNTIPTSTAAGIPGWLMQQDIVQCFAPVMTVRSDTFVVRCYGEADNQVTGSVEGKAWCEAVVQRVPEYIDPANPDNTPVYNWSSYASTSGVSGAPLTQSITGTHSNGSNLTTINLTFGRRFKVVSFRWLNATDL